jgi:Mrp family chromosome partitioning ATPase/capsular polysaccharide biosynthesis protein
MRKRLRRYLVIILATLVGAAVAYGLAKRQHSEYAATAELAVIQQALPTTPQSTGSGSAQSLQRQVETLASIADSPLVAKLALRHGPKVGWSVNDLLSHTSVQPSANADVLTIRTTAGSSDLASAWAVAYAGAFRDYRKNQTMLAIHTQLEAVNRKIRSANAAIAIDQRGGGTPTAEHRQELSSALNQRADLDSAAASAADGMSVLQAGGDAARIAPRPTRSAALGGVIGLALGLALAAALAALDRRVAGVADIEEFLSANNLGRIGVAPRRYRRRSNLVMLEAPDSAHAESYRMAATGLDLAVLRQPAKTIAISSAVQGEGKSTLTANLAVVYASAGRSVALVDLDLRRPAIAKLFGLTRQGPRIGQVIRGQLDVSAVLETVDLPIPLDGNGRLGVLAPRAPEKNALPYLTRAALSGIAEELKSSHDIVLFDTPPLLAVSEPAIIASCCDAIALVVRPGVATTPALVDLSQLLDALSVPVLGYVANGVAHGGGYGYGYGYGVGYGDSGNGHRDHETVGDPPTVAHATPRDTD